MRVAKQIEACRTDDARQAAAPRQERSPKARRQGQKLGAVGVVFSRGVSHPGAGMRPSTEKGVGINRDICLDSTEEACYPEMRTVLAEDALFSHGCASSRAIGVSERSTVGRRRFWHS